jgi:putative GTP pyrophosphokinase
MAGRAKDLESIEGLVHRYKEKRPLFEQFATKMRDLVKELLDTERIRYSIIESRCKEIESFRGKVARSEKDYSDPLVEITDLAGIRVILYYHDDLPLMKSLITQEFALDESSSIDKGEVLQPHEFGYRSVHYIVSLREARSTLSEWKRFEKMKAEIQVRTVLQHAWAAISHAIDYKQVLDAPTPLRRRLFRMSALLELGDEQFSLIRKEREEMLAQTGEQIERQELNIELNFDSIKEFLASSTFVGEIVAEARASGFVVFDEDDFISILVSHCNFLDLNTIDSLREALTSSSKAAYSVYLSRLIAGEAGKGWDASPSFVVLLVLLYVKRKKVSVENLVALGGWQKEVAERVLHAIEETHHAK